jgi:hypothetical protein
MDYSAIIVPINNGLILKERPALGGKIVLRERRSVITFSTLFPTWDPVPLGKRSREDVRGVKEVTG